MTHRQFDAYLRLIRFDKPIGIYLLLWPTLWALWVAAEGIPPLSILMIFVLGVFLMRSAGCAINDYADRDIDLHVERTKARPIAAGEISANEALAAFGLLCFAAFCLVLMLNTTTIILAFIAALMAASYPFMKRFHHLPQVHLGVSFSMAIPMAFSALQEGNIASIAWWLFITNIIWVVTYDTMYAMSDREDDIKIGVKSTAILFGDNDKMIIAILQTLSITLLVWIGYLAGRGSIYYLGLIAATGFVIYQQYLIRNRERVPCFHAFLNNNWLGLCVFLGLSLDYALE